jgi:signal transduction histidine kinase/FixJ family two-component response regulator
MSGSNSERALILAPHGRDASVAAAMLTEAGIAARICPTLGDLVGAFGEGAGFACVTEEALATADLHPLSGWLAAQEEWSDLPFILLTTRGGGLERNPAAARHLELLGNVTFLERPFHPTTLVSLARSALRGRRRQYEARARLIELHDGAERYRSLFESIDAGFCVLEVLFEGDRAVDYCYLEVNPAFESQTGLSDVQGKCVNALVPDHERYWFDTYGAVAKTGTPVRFENEAASLGRWYDVHAFSIGDPALCRVAVLFNDITVRRMIELELRALTQTLEQRVDAATAEREAAIAQLHEAQKLETIGQLTGGVAHDFNNLLTPITGALDLLNRRYGKEDARAARLIGGALESAERARTLVQRLLGFARRQALQTRAIDLGGLLDGMRDLVASSVGPTIELHVRTARDLPPAQADPNQLELALLNLCVNARDAMPNGGRLTLSAEPAMLGPGELPGTAPGLYVRLSVIDGGAGMDEATLARAVEPFFSTKEVGKGTGVGLSMVHGLASQLGGGLKLTSAPGQGTRVDLWLPAAADAPVEQLSAGGDGAANPRRPLTILLVDDELLVRRATAEMLRELGHSVHEAASGAEALSWLAGAAADIVVTDYKMPRMTGADLAEALAKAHPGLPVLLITGYTGPAEDAPNLPRLDKPFRRGDLSRAIEKLTAPGGEVVHLPRRRGSG